MPRLTCLMCGNRIIPAGRGRPPRWCSDPCRYRAHNRLRHLRVKRARAEGDGLERRAAYLTDWITRLETTNAQLPETAESPIPSTTGAGVP